MENNLLFKQSAAPMLALLAGATTKASGGSWSLNFTPTNLKIIGCNHNFLLDHEQIEILNTPIQIKVQDGIDVQGELFLKVKKRADQNKTVQGEFFSQN